MLIIPAIDLKDGSCVRLKQGELNNATVFSDKPEEMAARWQAEGAERLHLVDLNGAFVGTPQNKEAILNILKTLNGKIPVELGGGIRDLKTIENVLDWGVQWVILGTVAVQNPNIVKEACREFPNRIIIGLDAKDGKIATDGWAKLSDLSVLECAKRFEDSGAIGIIYTDIARDGMMTGINVQATDKLAQSLKIPVFASGGLSSLSDIESLALTGTIKGVIAGRALYNGAIDFAQALKTIAVVRRAF